jgi:MFS family permease
VDGKNGIQYSRGSLVRSLVALILGTLVLRAAAGAMGENIQFYFNYINEATRSLSHPLHLIAGLGNVSEISYTVGAFIITIFFAAEVIGAPLFGAWSDRYGRKLFIIFGPLFGALAVQLTAVTTVLWLLAVTRVLEGLSTASNAPASLGYIAEATSHAPKLRARVVGLFEVATIAGMAVGLVLGGALWRSFGQAAVVFGIPLTSPAFAINSVIYILSLIILWFGLSEAHEFKRSQRITNNNGTWRHYWQLVRNPRVESFVPAWIAINAVIGVFINLTARLLTDKQNFPDQLLMGGFDSFETGVLRGTYLGFFVLGVLLWSLFFAAMKKTTVMLIGIGGLFLTCLFLILINHQPSLDAPLVLPLAILLVFSIMVQSGFTPAAVVHLADITEEYTEDRGVIMGLYSVFLGVGQAIGIIGGPFADWRGVDGIILLIFLLGVFAAAFLIPLRRSEAKIEESKILHARKPGQSFGE